MGTFLNFVCPGVYIEQNAPRAVRSKARVWTERHARGAFKDQRPQKTVTDNGVKKTYWRGSFCVGSGMHELRFSALLHPEETKA